MTRMAGIAPATAAALAMAIEPAIAKPAPRLGRTVVVKTTDGRVTVKVRHHKHARLGAHAVAIPVGSTVDATHGEVKLTSARKSKGTQSGFFSEGAFVVTHRKSDSLTDLALTGGSFKACKAARAAGKPISAAANRRR